MSTTVFTQIEGLLNGLSREEQLRLIEEIAHRLRQNATPQQQRVRLRGILKGHVPSDFDLDQALTEIRSEWTKELDDLEG